jgi:hypothetical protein
MTCRVPGVARPVTSGPVYRSSTANTSAGREQYDILPHPNCEVRLKRLLKVHSEAAVIVEPGMAKCVTVTRLFTGLSEYQVPDA